METRDISLHGRMEDLLALVVGSIFLAAGIALLHAAGLVTGGTGGVALLLSKAVPLSPGIIFALLNLPFLWLAARTVGSLFAFRTLAVSCLVALWSTVIELGVRIEVQQPAIAAVSAGVLFGVGALALVRHGASVGGVGVLTVWLYRTRGWGIGRMQIMMDLIILTASSFIIPIGQIFWSTVSAIIMGIVMQMWHRPGLYTSQSPVKFIR